MFCFQCNRASAQTTQVKDTVYINQLFSAADKVLNPDSAIVLFDNVLKLSISANYPDGAFRALITKGIKYYEKEDYIQYRNTTAKAIPWAEKSSMPDAVAWCYLNIGEAYFCEGDYTEASQYYYTALKELRKKSNEPNHTEANIYNCLGNVHLRLNQVDKALGYFDQEEDVARRGKLFYQLAEAFINKGKYYNNIHKPDSASKYFNQVMDIGKKIGKVDLQAIANANLGKTLIESGEYEKAISYLHSAISLAKDRFDYIVVSASNTLGDALFRLHKYAEAELVLESALQETKAHNFKDNYINCYSKLGAVYKASGQYRKAIECMDTLLALKDSLTSTEKTRTINQMEIKYNTAEKDKLIAQNQLLIARQKSKIIQKNIWIAAIAGSIIFLSVILLSLYSRARNKQRLQAEQIKSLEHENKIGVLKAVVQGEEKERSRIAGELHDGLGGMLSAAMMGFMAIRHENEHITTIKAYKEAMDLLGTIGDEIRKTAHNLMPEVLLKQPLPEALRTYCYSLTEGGTLQIDFQSYGPFENITQDAKLNIYRIVQELLKNITQHARASQVLVQLLVHEQVLTITVEDNGVGYNTNEVKNGFGLYNLQTRVNSMDGHYTLESDPGKGTSVYIEFDIRNVTTS